MIASSVFLFIPSGGEFILVIIAVLLLFGADKIPDFAKLVGKGMKEFRKATEDIKREINVDTQVIREEVKKGERAIRREVDNIKSDFEKVSDKVSEDIGDTSTQEALSSENDLDSSKTKKDDIRTEPETTKISAQDDIVSDTSSTKKQTPEADSDNQAKI